MSQRRVVVTGTGAITPLGNSVTDFWNNLLAGKSGAGPITRFDTSKFKTHFACEVKGYDPKEHFEVKEARKMDLFTQYAIVSATQAVEDSGMNLDKINKRRVGVIWGSGNGGFLTFQEQVMEFAKGDGTPRFSPFFIPKVIPDIAAGWISMKYGFMGPNFITVSACATSTTSLIEAFNYIKWNKADIMIAGGSEAAINESGIGGFGALKALSTRNDDPQSASRPFDESRDGFVMGEGGVALVLEDYEHAKARGAKIYAEIAGGGMSADAYHLTSTHPEGEGAYLGMQLALEEAGLQPADVDYLNVHATSTPLGDESESKAIVRFFGNDPQHLNISATKSATGHLLGGAGAIEALICVLAVQNDVVPATINTQTVDPVIPATLNLTLGSKVHKPVNVAMSNTFGFGGHNATMVMKKWKE
ncbi:MAG: beta-ketoacyl-[acyl-carrier-protein] synthase II [Azospira oryzae]|nr:beta-ketoacyl-[acyl-carrier-protein] synthase II [Cytophaga sp.]PZR34619.1 MAG: beta-ketoacyl-[acyl-carrier-protein] synthase II [Azospira oryzae]